MLSTLKENRWLLLAAVAAEAAFLYLAFLGDLRPRVPRAWVGLFFAFAAYGPAAAYLCRRPSGSLRLILLAALAFRLTLLWSPPALSDDIYRYIWDGRVQEAGINPYRYAPQARELAPLRNALYAGINHKEVPTIYPPLAQLFFRLVAAIHPGVAAMKMGWVALEGFLIALLVRILRRRRQDPRRVLLYAWNPLAVVEIAGSGHSDPLGVLLMLLALYWLVEGRRSAAVWALAGAFLAKLLPLLLLPLFWRRREAKAAGILRGCWTLLWFPALSVLGFGLYASAGARLFAGLYRYLDKWRFNDFLFALFYHALKDPRLEWDDPALFHAKLICAFLLLGVVAWSFLRHRADPYRAAFAIMGAQLLLSPTLHPWYLLWILPFLALFAQPAWLLLSALIFLSYEAQIGYAQRGIWEEKSWVLWAQYAPFYLLLLYGGARRLKGRKLIPGG